MKNITQLFSAFLPWLLFLFTSKGFCYQQIHCQWGPYGDWSECDGCTKLQSRSRAMQVYAQFGGNACTGAQTETRSCETTKRCPLEDGCGDRFRCRSGMCVSQSLLCNGDQDCEEDGLDESVCSAQKHTVCENSVLPPNIEQIGCGFDVLSGKQRGIVINTKSFGGQCRIIFSGVHNAAYRLPLCTTHFSFMVKVQSDFSDESFTSKWHYAKDIIERHRLSGTTTGFHNYDFHETVDETQIHKVLVLKNDIEVAQFHNNAPQYIPISEEFWKALANLPSVYDYSAYRKVLETFGTHYVSEGSLGGSLNVVARIDEKTAHHMSSEHYKYETCDKTERWILIFPITSTTCSRDQRDRTSSKSSPGNANNRLKKVNVEGGGVQQIAALMNMELSDPRKNLEMYSNWADSLRSFPQIIKKKLRPLSELVKEVQCAGVKRLYLRRAIEQYLAENDPCHCRPCSNNGMVFMDGHECKCICKYGTSGAACEVGTEVDSQQGVIHGSWSCWSAWSSCSGGRRSRNRLCSNPTPQNGGQLCTGEYTEASDCEDQELQYLKTMEPQCFDQALPANQKCGTPPSLINGYVLEPKDIYLVGSKVEYTCIQGFYLVGLNTLECTTTQTWSANPGLCIASTCRIESLAEDVTASPLKQAYGIGESVTLSCPDGRQLLGEATVICNPSLQFSPDPANTQCSTTSSNTVTPPVQCKLWEKVSRGECVCKMPFECTSSLELCATTPGSRRFVLVNVCKMHALQCLGKKQTIAEDSTCKWPERNTTGCTNCHMWETCDDQSKLCLCKDSADCLSPGINVCVRVGDDPTAGTQTMSECEAGLRRCKGETVSVVSILPCAS